MGLPEKKLGLQEKWGKNLGNDDYRNALDAMITELHRTLRKIMKHEDDRAPAKTSRFYVSHLPSFIVHLSYKGLSYSSISLPYKSHGMKDRTHGK